MKSISLNQDTKRRIIRSVVNDTFKADKARITEMEHVLALKFYEEMYQPWERRQLAKLATGGWFCERNTIRVSIGSQVHDLDLPAPLPFKHTHHNQYAVLFALEATHPLAAEYEAFNRAQSGYEDQREKFENEAGAIIRSARTTKQLLIAWPEIVAWLPIEVTAGHARLLPAVQVEDLNKLICEKLGPKAGTCQE